MGTPDDDREQDAALGLGLDDIAVDNGIEIQATEHIPTVTNQRFLTDISSVNEFYSLPKKQIKPSGKLPSTPFEAFDMSVYKEKAHFNAFRSSPNRLPYWILASYKIEYEYLGKDDNYFIGWNDKVDDHDEFDHIL